ncbi:MAG: DUF362 domain-containing protein [Deltaproteobacteria bacterium]|jgi:uncharacterized Fe-S center protein|nr:DUF362 domain-containing protein [Deltaproteobacteria bacterium]
MKEADVFFTSARCKLGDSLLNKMKRLMDKAGIETIDFKKKFVAIKIHFGEPGNLAFLRPNFAKTLATKIAFLKGRPFLTDCGTLYVGRRTHALSHLDAAYENGYTPYAAGCQIIIGDGLKGTDEIDAPIDGGVLLTHAKIGRAIMDADIVVSLNHFKGHEMSGFGGAIKNLGMGSGSRAGKMIMHNDSKPRVNAKYCVGCEECAKHCAQSAISFQKRKASIDQELCVGCGRCLGSCPQNAIVNSWSSGPDNLCRKMVEYAKAVVQNRPNFHINVVNQVSPFCDCHSENDAAIVPDIGIFASFDPVALDQASADAVNKAHALAGTIVDERAPVAGDHFTSVHPTTNWKVQIEHAEKVGLGTGAYKITEVF